MSINFDQFNASLWLKKTINFFKKKLLKNKIENNMIYIIFRIYKNGIYIFS